MKSPRAKLKAAQLASSFRGEVYVSVKMGSDVKRPANHQSTPIYSQGPEWVVRTKRNPKHTEHAFPSVFVSPEVLHSVGSSFVIEGHHIVHKRTKNQAIPKTFIKNVLSGTTQQFVGGEWVTVDPVSPAQSRKKAPSVSAKRVEKIQQYSASQFGAGLGAEPESAKRVDTSGLASYGDRHIEALYRSRSK
ncbi:hypothetical protein [Burkholderia ambifaria]|uniref:hypothetical protein n=1 Tax=Burkholderia ambifaria TaxID=152480 RepID=UPI00158A742A|nr:hypothetical protein [Burkholderia ambifaria]